MKNTASGAPAFKINYTPGATNPAKGFNISPERVEAISAKVESVLKELPDEFSQDDILKGVVPFLQSAEEAMVIGLYIGETTEKMSSLSQLTGLLGRNKSFTFQL